MAEFTRSDLTTIMRDCIGASDYQELSESEFDTEFAELGYDSLLVLEIATRIQDQYRIRIPDEAVEEMKSPNGMLESVRQRLAVV